MPNETRGAAPTGYTVRGSARTTKLSKIPGLKRVDNQDSVHTYQTPRGDGTGGLPSTRLPQSTRGGGTELGKYGLVVLGNQIVGGIPQGRVDLPDYVKQRAMCVVEDAQTGQITLVSDVRHQEVVPDFVEKDAQDLEQDLSELKVRRNAERKGFQMPEKETKTVQFHTDLGTLVCRCVDVLINPQQIVLCFRVADNSFIPKPGLEMDVEIEQKTYPVRVTPYGFTYAEIGGGFIILELRNTESSGE